MTTIICADEYAKKTGRERAVFSMPHPPDRPYRPGRSWFPATTPLQAPIPSTRQTPHVDEQALMGLGYRCNRAAMVPNEMVIGRGGINANFARANANVACAVLSQTIPRKPLKILTICTNTVTQQLMLF